MFEHFFDANSQPRDVIERPPAPALPWDSLHQLFGTMGNTNSGNLVSAAAGFPSSELSRRSRESGGPGPARPAPPRICTGQSVSWGYRGGAAQAHTGPPPARRSRGVRPALAVYIRQDENPALLLCPTRRSEAGSTRRVGSRVHGGGGGRPLGRRKKYSRAWPHH
jgi:hypothetical protein